MVNSTVVAKLTVYVNPTIGDDANNGTQLHPYRTLSHAIKDITTPTMIHLAPGIYSTASGEVFPLILPSDVIVVGDEANKGQGMVISGSGQYESASFGVQNITILFLSEAQLLGVTVVNPVEKGTGVWIESTASPILANSTFVKCGREGVFVTGTAKPVIQDNVFVQNGVGGLVMAHHTRGKVLRNVLHKNAIGIAISDYAAPLVVNNTLSHNRTAIALSRNSRPVLRDNLIENNIQSGLLVHGSATPDLGNIQDPASNIFRHNGQFDIQNNTSVKLISVGNQLNPAQVKGLVELLATTPVSVNTSFSDMTGHWAAAFVEALHSRNLMSGFGDGTFRPEAPITRAQYAALVAGCFQPTPKRATPNFIDIPKDFWAYRAIKIATAAGFVGGFSDRTFRPEQNVLRLQVIVSLVNGLVLKAAAHKFLLAYSDRHEIPNSALTAVATATQNKIIVNYPDPKQLQLNREVTRSEVAAMVYQALVAIGRTPSMNSPYIVSPSTL
jgi:parallel beta-helix repeat protein